MLPLQSIGLFALFRNREVFTEVGFICLAIIINLLICNILVSVSYRVSSLLDLYNQRGRSSYEMSKNYGKVSLRTGKSVLRKIVIRNYRVNSKDTRIKYYLGIFVFTYILTFLLP